MNMKAQGLIYSHFKVQERKKEAGLTGERVAANLERARNHQLDSRSVLYSTFV